MKYNTGNYFTVDNPDYHPLLKDKIMIVVGSDSIRGTVNLNSLIELDNIVMPLVSQFEKFVRPIELTEKWLIVFGFVKRYPDGLDEFPHWIGDGVDICDFEDGVYEFNSTGFTFTNVHVFQDLYFGMTGSEIKIRE